MASSSRTGFPRGRIGWIAGTVVLIVVGAIVGFLVKTVLWIALIAGGVYLIGAIAARSRRNQVGRR